MDADISTSLVKHYTSDIKSASSTDAPMNKLFPEMTSPQDPFVTDVLVEEGEAGVVYGDAETTEFHVGEVASRKGERLLPTPLVRVVHGNPGHVARCRVAHAPKYPDVVT